MTLTIYNELEQGSPAWDDLRRGMVTASTVGQLVTPKTIKPAMNDKVRAIAYQLAAERITGFTEPTYTSFDMEEGHVNEPLARDAYSEHFELAEECGFMVRQFDGFKIGYSPDGVVGEDGLIEVKSRAPKKHLATIVAGEVPSENIGQCQAALLVSGRAWLDYVSYSGGMKLWVKRVLPDPVWHAAILEAVQSFEESATNMAAVYQANTFGMPDTERMPDFQEMELKL